MRYSGWSRDVSSPIILRDVIVAVGGWTEARAPLDMGSYRHGLGYKGARTRPLPTITVTHGATWPTRHGHPRARSFTSIGIDGDVLRCVHSHSSVKSP